MGGFEHDTLGIEVSSHSLWSKDHMLGAVHMSTQ